MDDSEIIVTIIDRKEAYISSAKTVKTRVFYKLRIGDEIYRAIDWEGLAMPIVYDDDVHDHVSEFHWYLMHHGYAACKTCQHLYFHRLVMNLNGVFETEPSIDHINQFKLDNREENLRYASWSAQTSNRTSRADKKEPLQELKDIGVEEYPRNVRWDNGEGKFVIDKHPALSKRVEAGLIKKAVMSGTKSTKATIVEKYQDILARLSELNDEYSAHLDAGFEDKKRKLREEYVAIAKTIKEGFRLPLTKITVPPHLEPRRRVLGVNKKTTIKLPEDCGVSVDMLPKYTHYRPATDKRGDRFTLERKGVYVWSTSESRSLSTTQKFQQLMDHVRDLPEDVKSRLNF